jgi:hypothetical protein
VTAGDTGPINPFLVPKQQRQEDPLRPWDIPEHEECYVDVDGVNEAYEEFQGEFTDADLSRNGRLVIASGPRGCGKSSLINRAGMWLRDHLETGGKRGVIIDLTNACGPQHDTEQRLTLTRHRLIKMLERENALPDSVRERPQDDLAVELTYGDISLGLADDLVLLILLPRSEVIEELVRYSALAFANIVLFGEIDSTTDVQRYRGEMSANGRPPVEMPVGILEIDDFWEYAKARQTRPDGSRIKGPTTEEEMQKLRTGEPEFWSIKRLHMLVAGAYEAKLKATQARVDTLTSMEIQVYGFQELTRGGQGG